MSALSRMAFFVFTGLLPILVKSRRFLVQQRLFE